MKMQTIFYEKKANRAFVPGHLYIMKDSKSYKSAPYVFFCGITSTEPSLTEMVCGNAVYDTSQQLPEQWIDVTDHFVLQQVASL